MSRPREIVSAASLAVAVVAIGGASVAFADSGRDPRVHKVEMEDDCHPRSFNAAVPSEPGQPPTCVGDGDTRFEEFVEELLEDGEHNKWRFHPDDMTIRRGDRIKAVVDGGEFHSFTKVPRFGPGCVPDINELIGFGRDAEPVVDCSLLATTGTGPGGAVHVRGLTPGMHKFECLIHPWMRTVVEVRRR